MNLICASTNFGLEKKIVYLGHRKFLKSKYPYRRLQNTFNGEQEFDIAPKPLTGFEVYKRQKYINVAFSMSKKGPVEKIYGKRGSVL